MSFAKYQLWPAHCKNKNRQVEFTKLIELNFYQTIFTYLVVHQWYGIEVRGWILTLLPPHFPKITFELKKTKKTKTNWGQFPRTFEIINKVWWNSTKNYGKIKNKTIEIKDSVIKDIFKEAELDCS